MDREDSFLGPTSRRPVFKTGYSTMRSDNEPHDMVGTMEGVE